jgi:hypothetical protein
MFPSSLMESTKKRPGRTGPIVVVVMVLAAIVGALATWRGYIAERPSTTDARAVSGSIIEAVYPADRADGVLPRQRAIVSVSHRPTVRIPAVVTSSRREGETTIVTLEVEPGAVAAGDACDVTIDQTIVAESDGN